MLGSSDGEQIQPSAAKTSKEDNTMGDIDFRPNSDTSF